MRIAVLGASGRTGRHVVEQALGHGHEVAALVRDPSRLTIRHGRLASFTGDVLEPDTLSPLLADADAVVSAIGAAPAGTGVHVYSDGIANTLRAMTAAGVPRIVVMSAAGAGDRAGKGLPLVYRMLMATPGMRALYDDLERMEGDVMLSDADWTIVRPAGLTDGEQTGHYRVVEGSVVPKGSRIARPDVAALMLKCAEGDLYSRRAVAVAY